MVRRLPVRHRCFIPPLAVQHSPKGQGHKTQNTLRSYVTKSTTPHLSEMSHGTMEQWKHKRNRYQEVHQILLSHKIK